MTTEITLARPYAKAVFEIAKQNHQFDFWSQLLASMASVVQIEEVMVLLNNPNISSEQIYEVMIGSLKSSLDEVPCSFIKTLAVNHRLGLLPAIAELFEEYRLEAEKKIVVEVTSAYPLVGETKERLIKALQIRLQREVELQCEIDPTLLGGVIARAGDLVIDGSIKGKLAKMKQFLES